MSQDEDLKSFKISDQVKTPVDRQQAKESTPEPPPSVGFPTIEALLDSESLDLSSISERHEILAEEAKTGSTPKAKAHAKKAMIAYERAMDLLEYLVATKNQLRGDE